VERKKNLGRRELEGFILLHAIKSFLIWRNSKIVLDENFWKILGSLDKFSNCNLFKYINHKHSFIVLYKNKKGTKKYLKNSLFQSVHIFLVASVKGLDVNKGS
jgi:hypothetical protein